MLLQSVGFGNQLTVEEVVGSHQVNVFYFRTWKVGCAGLPELVYLHFESLMVRNGEVRVSVSVDGHLVMRLFAELL